MPITAAIALSLIIIAIFIYATWNRYRYEYGVLWDRGNRPVCPICHRTLTRHNEYGVDRFAVDGTLYCAKCEVPFALIDTANGRQLSPEEARNLVVTT